MAYQAGNPGTAQSADDGDFGYDLTIKYNENFVELYGRVVVNAGALAGAAPANSLIGIDQTNDQVYIVNGAGDWAAATSSGPTSYNTFADVPLATSVLVGTMATVVNDGANNGSYVAVGAAVGNNATAWV